MLNTPHKAVCLAIAGYAYNISQIVGCCPQPWPGGRTPGEALNGPPQRHSTMVMTPNIFSGKSS